MFEKEAEEWVKSKGKDFGHFPVDCVEAYQKGAEYGYNKANEWHYCKDELPPIGETVLLFYGSDIMGKVVMSTGSIDSKGIWYKNVDDTPIMWKSINLPSNKNITRDYLYCDNQLLSERC